MNKIFVILISVFLLTGYISTEAKTLDNAGQENLGAGTQMKDARGEEKIINNNLDKEIILGMVKSSPVIATVKIDTDVLEHYNKKNIIGNLPRDSKVEIIKDRAYKWYNVKSNDGLSGWVEAKALNIPEEPSTVEQKMTKEQLEAYVNYKGLGSDTEYLVWVDIARQQTHVFLGVKGGWELVKTFICSTGENISPTLRGEFTVLDRGTWFYSPEFESGAKFWVRYNDTYMFHSVAMDINKSVTDSTLGKRASAGCIRLAEGDAEWFYNNIPMASMIFIN